MVEVEITRSHGKTEQRQYPPDRFDSLVRHWAFSSSTLLAESRRAPVCELGEALNLSVNGMLGDNLKCARLLHHWRWVLAHCPASESA
jgi:hypothetical protein